jgi:hypothetical protein
MPRARERKDVLTAPPSLHEAVSSFKRRLVLETLALYEGNRSRAAAALMIERTSLLRLIRDLGITDALPGGRPGRPPEEARPRRRTAAPTDKKNVPQMSH